MRSLAGCALVVLVIGCSNQTESPCVIANPVAEANPGHIENAERDFKVLFGAMTKYRTIHGKLPEFSELTNFSKEIVPGIQLKADDFLCEDYKYSDSYQADSERKTEYAIVGPDGSDFSKRGVVLSTNMYVRSHAARCADGLNKYHYTGFHLVMWNDGKLERIKPGDMMMEVRGGIRYLDIPPGLTETGTAQTMREYYRTADVSKHNPRTFE